MAISKNLQKLTTQMQKKFGTSMVAVATERTDMEIVTHPTGSLMMDLAIGTADRAGIPEGRLIEVYGPESQGKTSLTLLMIAARQREEDMREQLDPNYVKKACVFVDAEHALDFRLAEEYGVDLNQLIYINPEVAEQAMDMVDAFVRSGEVGLIVIDSVN